jgi:hypothetical protein
MVYNPPVTDAVLLNPDGTVNGPVNPDICASRSDCEALVENLTGAKIIPAGTSVLILDEPWTEAADSVRYGKDGRRIFGLHFTGADGLNYWENVELCLIWLKREPYPGSQWELTPVDLIRVGNTVGSPFYRRITQHCPDNILLRRRFRLMTELQDHSKDALWYPDHFGLRSEKGLTSPHYPTLAPKA